MAQARLSLRLLFVWVFLLFHRQRFLDAAHTEKGLVKPRGEGMQLKGLGNKQAFRASSLPRAVKKYLAVV